MILQTQIIPMPVYYHDGPSGPWTEGDTKITIAIYIALAIWWFVSNLIEITFNKTTIKESFMNKVWDGYANTYLANMFFYIVNACIAFFYLIYVIYLML